MRANLIKRKLALLNRIEREAWKEFHARASPHPLETVLNVIDARCRLLGLYPSETQATKKQARRGHAQ